MPPARMDRIEIAPRLAMDFTTALNRGDVDAACGYLADECSLEPADTLLDGGVIRGKDAVRAYLAAAGKTEGTVVMEETVGMGLQCLVIWRRQNAGGGVAAKGADIFTVRGGLIRAIKRYVKSAV